LSVRARVVAALFLVLGWMAPAAASTVAMISRFTVIRDGQVILDDTFAGQAASLTTPRMVDGQATEYVVIGFIPDGSAAKGKLSLRSADGNQSATADGRGRRSTVVQLMTNDDPGNTGTGLKSGSTFSMSGLFDFVVPGGPVEGYGIRFGNGAGPRRPSHVVSLFVFRNETNALVLRFLHQDFEAGKQYVVEEPAIDAGAGDQILLTLSRDGLSSSGVTAQYQFVRNGAPTSAPIALTKSAPVFGGGQRNWTRAEFFVFEQAPLPGR
jgi:hypothetical protein